jgi:hypothetical protein
MSVKQNAMNRAVVSVGLAVNKHIRERDRARANMAFREAVLQYQLPISGSADGVYRSATIDLDFEIHFHYAPYNRDSDFDRPEVSTGVVLSGDTDVIIDLKVVKWNIDEETDAVTGATVKVSAFVLGGSTDGFDTTPFEGYAHVSFQGWAGVHEDETEL